MKTRFVLVAALLGGAVAVGACVSDAPPANSCSATQKLCAGKCVASDDPANGCGNVDCTPCAAPGANATSACVSGACSNTCAAGFDDCDSNPANGCEAKVDSDVANCGACGNACGSANTGSAPTCQAGKCVFSCSQGFGHCGPDAAGCDTDLQTSPDNCGACGHSCGGATCTGGKCDPIQLTTANLPEGIAVDATDVYYTLRAADMVMRIGKDGTCKPASPCPQVIASGAAPEVRGPEAVISDGTNVYWTAAAAGKIGWVPAAGGTVNGIGTNGITGNTEPGVLAIAGGKLWWTSGASSLNRLHRADLDGSNITVAATGSFAGRGGVTADANNVFWVNDQGSLYSTGFNDAQCAETTSCKHVATAANAVGIAVDDTYVYWTSPTGGVVQRAPKTGGSNSVIAKNQDMPQSIVVDGKYVYWGNIGTGPVGASIRRAPIAGGTCDGAACEVFEKVPVPNALAIDADALYWVDKSASGGVYKVVK